MSIGGWLFASMYDRLTAGAEAAGLSKHREHLLASAEGRVLEIGAEREPICVSIPVSLRA